MKVIGIYKIISPTGRVYIGQSVNCLTRLKWYRCGAKNQRTLNNSILKYGWDAHHFEIIHECKEEELNELEKYYAILFNSYSKDVGMNIRECGGSRGRISDETKKIMSEKQKSRLKNNPEERQRIGNWNRGKKPSEEVRLKISNSLKGKQIGKVVSKETRKRLSEANTGKTHSAATKIKLSVINRGKTMSEEAIRKIREANIGRRHSDISKKKMSEAQKGERSYMYGKQMSNDVKQKISESNKGKVFSEKHRINLSESKKGHKNPMFGKINTPEMKRINSEKNSRGNNSFAKLVLNTETGIFYECAKDAWESFQRQSFEYFKFKLQGKNHVNNTSFIYV